MKWVTIVFIVFLILIVIIANLGLGPSFFPFVYRIPGGDKLGHFFLMGILSFLLNSVLKTRKFQIFAINFLVGSLIVMAIVTIEEFSQKFLEFRAFSIIDLLFDYTGIIVFGRISLLFSDRQVQQQYLDKAD
jgi:VanZ family protein